MTQTVNPTTYASATAEESINPQVRYSDELQPHAQRRMQQRGITSEMIMLTEQFGRIRYAKGAQHYIVGRKEVAEAAAQGQDLRSCNGMHLVLSSRGQIITVYRNGVMFRSVLRRE